MIALPNLGLFDDRDSFVVRFGMFGCFSLFSTAMFFWWSVRSTGHDNVKGSGSKTTLARLLAKNIIKTFLTLKGV